MEDGSLEIEENSEEVSIVIKDENDVNLRCPKKFLVEKSDYFSAMFSSGMVESHKNVVEIREVDLTVIKTLINYIKSDVLRLSQDNVYSILEGACRFQIRKAIGQCCEFLENNLCHSTCPATIECAISYHLEGVLKVAKRHMQHYFRQVVLTEEFLSIEMQTLRNILQEKALNVTSELDVYRALECWIDADKANRLCYLDEMLLLIHEEDIPDLAQNLPELKFLRTKLHKCNGEDSGSCKKQETTLSGDMNEKRIVKPKFREVPEELLCIGLRVIRYDERQVIWFDPRIFRIDFENKSSILKDNIVTTMEGVLTNTEGHGGYSVCVLNGKDIVVSGGEAVIGKNTWDFGVYCFDTFTQKWSTLTQLKSARRHHASCTINNSIYMIGGFGRFRVKLNSMEKYDCDTDEWSSLAPTPSHGFHNAVTVLQDRIYALFCSSAMFSYAPELDTWTKLQMKNKVDGGIAFLGAYTYNDRIYVRASHDLIHILELREESFFELTKTYTKFTRRNDESVGSHVLGVTLCNNAVYCFKSDDGTGRLTDVLKIDLTLGTQNEEDETQKSERRKFDDDEDSEEDNDVQIFMQNQLDFVSVPVY